MAQDSFHRHPVTDSLKPLSGVDAPDDLKSEAVDIQSILGKNSHIFSEDVTLHTKGGSG